MAIDSVKKLKIFAPLGRREGLLDELYKLRVLHVIDDLPGKHHKYFERLKESTDDSDDNLSKLKVIKSTLDLYVKRKKGLFESFFPIPLQLEQFEFDEILNFFDMESLYRECKCINEAYYSSVSNISNIETGLCNLSVFTELPDFTERLRHMKLVKTDIGLISHHRLREMSGDDDADKILTWQTVSSSGNRTKILIFYLRKEECVASKLLERYNIIRLPFPEIKGRITDNIDLLKKELQNLKVKQAELRDRVIGLSKHYNEVEIMLSYWENERDRRLAEGKFISSERTLVVSGYIREKDIDKLEDVLNRDFPESSCIYEEPDPKDDIPVSITLNRFFKPVQLLTNMFGLPNYFNFDPTPFLTIGFLFFFGICFGDVLYGLMLMAFSYYIMRKYNNYESIRNFFKLFLYAGVSTAVIGAMTGGWAGDIYNAEYLGEGNLVLRLRNSLIVIDPLARPIIALVFAISLGIINQFFGISLKMYGELRKGNVKNAVFDGVLWLIFLPGVIIITIPLFAKMPAWILNTGIYMIMVSAVGLVLTQGRNEKSRTGKLFTGFVSMYGILGSYGCTNFISDTLSYSRLLALGLTTTIIAMSINIIANIVKSAGIIGIAGFILILIVGHIFNFMICIIGSFVHPARLIFLEFFGRFYEGGATGFRPYGYNSRKVQLMDISQKYLPAGASGGNAIPLEK